MLERRGRVRGAIIGSFRGERGGLALLCGSYAWSMPGGEGVG